MHQLVEKFKRIESITFGTSEKFYEGSAVRISMTKSDGTDIDRVLYCTNEEVDIAAKMASDIQSILDKNKNIGMQSAVLAIWNILSKNT